MILLKQNHLVAVLLTAVLAFNTACDRGQDRQEASEIIKTEFGTLPDGRTADLYTIRNGVGSEVRITNFGGIITSLTVPDREGVREDVVLGFESLDGYLQKDVPYFGAIIGRFGNRIAGGRFTLEGQEYQLATNDGPNHLHGGEEGFDKVLWEAESFTSEEGAGVRMHYLSPHMEEGYPGNLDVTVTYTFTNDDELKIDYQATTDRATIVNLTNHSYFNLAGHDGPTIVDHFLKIEADKFLPVNQNLIPTGELREVEDSPFDFQQLKLVGERINAAHEQLKYGQGYDHCWVLDEDADGEMKLAASLFDRDSGRYMEVHTTEPGIQFYSGNFLDGSLSGKDGVIYRHRSGLCLETQHFPDAPNQPDFPSTELRPGETYHSKTTYAFSVR